jgi:transcriptional regulator with PAS, ATPase and Fis domain
MVERLSGGAYFAVDRDKNIIAFGPEMERITGISAEDALGRHCLNAFRCARCLERCAVFEQGAVGPSSVDIYRADGSTARVVKSARAVRDSEGRPVLAIERLHLADPLEGDSPEGSLEAVSPERMLDGLLLVLGRYYVVADEKMRVRRASERLAEVVGRSPQALLGVPLEEFLGAELFGQDSAFRAAVLAGERREGWRAFLTDGADRRLAVSLSAARFAGRLDGIDSADSAGEVSVLVVIRPEGHDEISVDDASSFGGMVARSPAMLDIFRLVRVLRDNDARVLITGESGTGKELVARAIHDYSHRADGPFVAVNCGALPGDLLESELFGHVRGAFTGAIRDKVGRFELADGGTLFLDEIGDLPLPLQVKLLRVLETSQFERLGDARPRRADVRVIAATNADLAKAVADKRFRDDLYYRLRVVPIEIPPLRERREDIEVLVHHLLRRIGRRRGRSLRLSPSSMRTLLRYDWPGNVRELENALEYATAICDGQTIHTADLPVEVQTAGAPPNGQSAPPKPDVVAAPAAERPAATAAETIPNAPPRGLSDDEREEARRIGEALEQTRYRRQAAADLLGISRWTLWRKMKQYGLDS